MKKWKVIDPHIPCCAFCEGDYSRSLAKAKRNGYPKGF